MNEFKHVQTVRVSLPWKGRSPRRTRSGAHGRKGRRSDTRTPRPWSQGYLVAGVARVPGTQKYLSFSLPHSPECVLPRESKSFGDRTPYPCRYPYIAFDFNFFYFYGMTEAHKNDSPISKVTQVCTSTYTYFYLLGAPLENVFIKLM